MLKLIHFTLQNQPLTVRNETTKPIQNQSRRIDKREPVQNRPIRQNVSVTWKDNYVSSDDDTYQDKSPNGSLRKSESVFSNSIKSGYTGASDWTSHISTITGDSSDSDSDWWNEFGPEVRRGNKVNRRADDDDDCYDGGIKLNLENEDKSDDELREHRLIQHLQVTI